MKLKLPLTYDEYAAVANIAYARMGGKDKVEDKVKGVTHYKGMTNDLGAGGGNTAATEGGGDSNSNSSNGNNGNNGSGARSGPRRDAMYGSVSEQFIQECIIERMRIHKESNFLDIGSGIGQICIQVSACTGCKSIGVEVDKRRNDLAGQLLQTFDQVLEEIQCEGRLTPLVTLLEKKLEDSHVEISASDCIFFDNFGPWFSELLPMFCRQLENCKAGTQCITMNSLIDAVWTFNLQFSSCKDPTSWTGNHLELFHYIIPKSATWACKSCTYENELHAESCIVCDVKKPKEGRSKNRGITQR